MSTKEGYCNINGCKAEAIIWWYPFGSLCCAHQLEAESNPEKIKKRTLRYQRAKRAERKVK